ncbi:DinB family protein [Nakamurella flavida]|uniref:DinB family protein n=1 Tax=Nakamurella flavida TaxID=363630 RepID=A0A938YHY0_9ACTN|nr:DinB family protein [Nakamurella flavida]MBM9478010.1 DinB family protein [Nakamurella flavida]MDP9778273.1 hypothetical protein [Nakamurella flavida]
MTSSPTTTDTAAATARDQSGEKADLLQALGQHRFFLTNTLREMTDEQAGARTTVSELCLGGLVKHVAATEAQWVRFILEGPAAMALSGDGDYEGDENGQEWAAAFSMNGTDTVESVLAQSQAVAERTAEVLAALPDLDASQPLPEAPWFPPGARWTARRVFIHLIAETAQHAGHADIIREAIDGAKSMG